MTVQPTPHNLSAERAVLGAILSDPGVLLVVQGEVGPDDFYAPEHGALFSLLLDLAAEGTPIDLVTVSERILRAGAAGRYGGAGYVAELPEHAPSSVNAGHYAAIVRDAAVRRRALAQVERVARALRGEVVGSDLDTETADDLVQRAAAVLGAQSTPRARNVWTVGEAVALTEREAAEAERSGSTTAWATGFSDLDAMLGGGLRPGDLVVVGGATSMGKSAFSMALSFGAAYHGHPVVYASCEPRRPEWSQRALSLVSGVPLERIRSPQLRTPADRELVAHWQRALCDYPVELFYRPGASVLDIATQARRAKLSPEGLDVLVVDYVQLMRHEQADRHDLAIGRTIGGLKALAGDLGIAVLALSQITRESQKDAPRRRATTGRWWDAVRLPTTFDLKESGSIENDADVILFPVRADKAAPGRRPVEGTRPEDAVVVVAKQRNGPTGEVPVEWDGPCACYRPEPPDRL